MDDEESSSGFSFSSCEFDDESGSSSGSGSGDDRGAAYDVVEEQPSMIVIAPRIHTPAPSDEPSNESPVMQLPPERVYDDEDRAAATRTDKRSKKLMIAMLCTIVLLALVVGLGVVFGTSSSDRNGSAAAAVSSSSNADTSTTVPEDNSSPTVTLEDCLAEQEENASESEGSTLSPTGAPTGGPTQRDKLSVWLAAAEPRTEPVAEGNSFLYDGSVRGRDLRGSMNGIASKNADEMRTAFEKQRKLEQCEELLAGSSKAPTPRPTASPTSTVTLDLPMEVMASPMPTKALTDSPIGPLADTATAVSPTKVPSVVPTDQPIKVPTEYPTKVPTLIPLKNPSGSPIDETVEEEPIIPSPATDSSYYQYGPSSSKCRGTDVTEGPNIDGPAPFEDKSNVALEFFVFGATPYDRYAETCIGEDGSKEDECTRFDCSAPSSELPADNTCTFEGEEYQCLKKAIIPYMNEKIANGDAAFMVHTGDMISGSGLAANNRCTNYTFSSRRELFSNGTNFLNVVGDNDWNECAGYDIESNTDPTRELWRDHFAKESSPFHQFTTEFSQPATTTTSSGMRPTLHRRAGNPEMWFFDYDKVAMFGLNLPGRGSFVKNEKINEDWVEERLNLDSSCTYESIVLISHTWPGEDLYSKISNYFDACDVILPILTVSGNLNPRSYCMSQIGNRIDVTVEAFYSAPLLISVVRDFDGERGARDYFHVLDVDGTDSNRECPTFEMLQ